MHYKYELINSLLSCFRDVLSVLNTAELMDTVLACETQDWAGLCRTLFIQSQYLHNNAER